MKGKFSFASAAEELKKKKKFLHQKWEEFCALYPTNEDCRKKLTPVQNECFKCHETDLCIKPGDKHVYCKHCNAKNLVFSDTFFSKIKTPRLWMGAVWMMQEGISFNAKDLQELAGVAYSSAWNVRLKLSMFLEITLRELPHALHTKSFYFSPVYKRRSLKTPANARPVDEEAETDTNASAQTETGPKTEKAPKADAERGRGAATDHPSEKTATEKEHSDQSQANSKNTQNGQAESKTAWLNRHLTANQKAVIEALSAAPMHFDEIVDKTNIPIASLASLLIMMELKELVEQQSGDIFALAGSLNEGLYLYDHSDKEPQDKHLNKIESRKKGFRKEGFEANAGEDQSFKRSSLHINHFQDNDYREGKEDRLLEAIAASIDFIVKDFQGISRKYIQMYLAAFWCKVDRDRWGSENFLYECRRFRKIKADEIRSYVSPPMVNLA